MVRNLERGARFCLEKCPLCVKGRKKGKGVLFSLLKVEARICPYCRDYEKYYGVPAYEKPPVR